MKDNKHFILLFMGYTGSKGKVLNFKRLYVDYLDNFDVVTRKINELQPALPFGLSHE